MYIALTHKWSSCSLPVPPNVTAESDSLKGIVNGNVVLNFTVGVEANPPVRSQHINVTFNGTPVVDGDHYSLQLNENIFTIVINSLTLADKGVYAVTVATTAGDDTAATMLEIYGEKNVLY